MILLNSLDILRSVELATGIKISSFNSWLEACERMFDFAGNVDTLWITAEDNKMDTDMYEACRGTIARQCPCGAIFSSSLLYGNNNFRTHARHTMIDT